ncbi:hypothetical protein JOQ06_009226, partial [Pogonophryne albipinna]
EASAALHPLSVAESYCPPVVDGHEDTGDPQQPSEADTEQDSPTASSPACTFQGHYGSIPPPLSGGRLSLVRLREPREVIIHSYEERLLGALPRYRPFSPLAL